MKIDTKEICREVRDSGILKEDGDVQITFVRSREVIFDPRIEFMCQTCRNYRKFWTCPPSINSKFFKRVINAYEYGYLVTLMKSPADPETPDTFSELPGDPGVGSRLHAQMIELEMRCRLKKPMARGFTTGRCMGCGDEKCAILTNAYICPKPELARPSLEGMGVDVYQTCKAAGIDMRECSRIYQDGHFVANVGLLMVE